MVSLSITIYTIIKVNNEKAVGLESIFGVLKIMETKSEFNSKFSIVWLWLIVIISLGIVALLIFVLANMILSRNAVPSNGLLIIFGILHSFFICTALNILLMTKTITVSDEFVEINYIFRKKKFTYQNNEILGYKQFEHSSLGYPKFEVFHLKTSCNKVIIIGSNEFSNYKQIISLISLRSRPIDMDKYYFSKPEVLSFFISLIIVTLIIVTTVFILKP